MSKQLVHMYEYWLLYTRMFKTKSTGRRCCYALDTNKIRT